MYVNCWPFDGTAEKAPELKAVRSLLNWERKIDKDRHEFDLGTSVCPLTVENKCDTGGGMGYYLHTSGTYDD